MKLDFKDPKFISNPYPVLEYYRNNHPIYEHSDQTYVITGYKECVDLMKNENILFPSFQVNDKESWFDLLKKQDQRSIILQFQKSKKFNANSLAFKNAPEHTRLKKIFLKSFRKTAIDDLEQAIVRICDGLIVELKSKKEINLVKDFCMPFTNSVILYIMGYEGDDHEYLRKLSIALLDSMQMHPSTSEKKRGIECTKLWAEKAQEFFDNPALISNHGLLHVMRQKVASGDLSEDEFVSNAALLIMAGQETTQSLIASCCYYFFKNDLHLKPNAHNYITPAINEVLRLEPPNMYITKFISNDFEHEGTTFKKGRKIHFFLGSANRDKGYFESPNNFIINRSFNDHISFGSGVHYCIGSFLSIKETEVAMRGILKNLPLLQLDSKPIVWKNTIRVRGLDELNFKNG